MTREDLSTVADTVTIATGLYLLVEAAVRLFG